jgi:GrpB-like predicted nucleotidyltransferase (UPF0157 family)
MVESELPGGGTLFGGRESGFVAVVAPDPSWAERFATHRARIATALGPVAARIEHIGSTSVPGLAAKPIVDVLVIGDGFDEPVLVELLPPAGYERRVSEPGHAMFRTPEHDVHVHAWEQANDVRRHLLFRDWLRADATDRARYEREKVELATRRWDDVNRYADAKSAIVAEITERAEVWAAQTGWRP